MPQMAPLWWEFLFIMFITTYIITSMVIYHTFDIKLNKKNKTSKSFKNMFWKW
uniref:ATP synthase F0 subunit 8 n=1 Tax=Cydnidae sp. ITV1034 TaxID=2508782 RepID=A0A481MW38_9HEMI|nr:ATP synthase F0 subunit 8 [Cydnidae sp. ITV1034]